MPGKGVPCAVAALPVTRRLPSPGLDSFPSSGKPELGPAVAAVFDELRESAVGDRMRRNLESTQPDAMPGRFIVETEITACVPDFVLAFDVANPAPDPGADLG